MVERLLCHEFSTSKSKASTAEAKSEIEVADFDRLLSKIENLPMRGKLKELLIKIKDSGFTKMDQAKSGGHILTRRRSKFTFIWQPLVGIQALRTNASDEFGYMSHKFNGMDTLTLIHSFRDLNFQDSYFNHRQFHLDD